MYGWMNGWIVRCIFGWRGRCIQYMDGWMDGLLVYVWIEGWRVAVEAI